MSGRHEDEVARWGGDEFLVLVDDADPERLFLVAERLRMVARRARLRSGRRRVPLAISIGGTLAIAGEYSETVLNRADLPLYRSKHTRRSEVATTTEAG